MTRLFNKGAEGDITTVTSLMRCAVLQHLNGTSRAVCLVTANEVCSHKTKVWGWDEVKSVSQGQRQQGTTEAQCIYSMAEASVQQPNPWVEAMWVEAPVGASHSSFPQPRVYCKYLIQGLHRPLTQIPKLVCRGRGGLQRKVVGDWAGQLELLGVLRVLRLPATVNDSWGHQKGMWTKRGQKGWETVLWSDLPVVWPLMCAL